jgi:four helix bundle protein
MVLPSDSPAQRQWEKSLPHPITSDVLWKLDAHRAAMYLVHLAKGDAGILAETVATARIADQLLRAAGSVSANLGEGYSRSTRADRLRFLGYALGSARECITWYHAASDTLPADLIDARLSLLMRIRSLLLGLIRAVRPAAQPPGRFER